MSFVTAEIPCAGLRAREQSPGWDSPPCSEMSHCEFRGLVFNVRDESFREASCRKGILVGGSYVLDWTHSIEKRGLTFEIKKNASSL